MGLVPKSQSLLADITPQLGGNLDVNGFSIVSTANGNIVIQPNGTGVSQIGAPQLTGNLDVNGFLITSNSNGSITIRPNGNGVIRLGGSDANHIEIEPDGTIEMVGNSTVWDDLRIVPGAFDFAGNNDPTLSDWQPGGAGTTFKVYKFAKNDEVFASCQMPHSYKVGTDLHFHIHWSPGDRGNEENGNFVGWKVDYSIASINGTFQASGTVDLSDACDGTDDKHQMTPDVEVDGSGITTVSAMIMLRIYRTDTGADDTWSSGVAAQQPILLEMDMHYELDTIGSREETTK